MLSLEVLYTLSSVVQTASKETTPCVKSSGGLQWKSIKLSGQEVVAVAYEWFLL